MSGCATPRPPAARLPRVSPGFGMRARQYGTGLPSISSTRLSPSRDLRDVALRHDRARAAAASGFRRSTSRFGSSGRTRKMLSPPMPSSGLRITSRCSSRKARIARRSRVTSVGAMNCGNSQDAELLVVVAQRGGLLKTRAPCARPAPAAGAVDVLHVEGRVLAHQHRVERGQRRAARFSCARYQASSLSASDSRPALRVARGPSQCRSSCCSTQTSWPRACASRIIATVVSL